MAEKLFERLAEKLLTSGLAREDSIVGCSESQIAEIEERCGVRLPVRYRDFLARMGRSAGLFLVGTAFLHPKLLKLRPDAEELVEEGGGDFRLAASHFVFVMHQGYQFLFFDCAESDDPAVWLFVEGDEEPTRVAESFSEWLAGCVDDEIRAFQMRS